MLEDAIHNLWWNVPLVTLDCKFNFQFQEQVDPYSLTSCCSVNIILIFIAHLYALIRFRVILITSFCHSKSKESKFFIIEIKCVLLLSSYKALKGF